MSTSALDLPATVRELPPTARLVFVALREAEGPVDRSELLAQTAACEDSLHRALNKLADRDLIKQSAHPADRRRQRYATTDLARP